MTGHVSVVIPCYNYGRFLRQCVQSVLTQAVAFDVCIIDDCSSDDTPQIGSRLAEQDARITFVRHSENRGHIATYNEGLERARGDYSLLLSADDLLAPGALRRACDVLDTNPSVVLVYGDVIEFLDTPPTTTPAVDTVVRIWNGQDFIAKSCGEVWNPISTPSAVVRTSAQHLVGGYRPTLPHAGDREMWLRLATQGDVAELQGGIQAYYRLHAENMHRRWFFDSLVNEREFRTTYETFFDHSAHLVRDGAELKRLCSRRLAERGIWWGYHQLRRRNVRGAFECLRFSVSVWNQQREVEASLLNLGDIFAPMSYAICERHRRRRGTRGRWRLTQTGEDRTVVS